jgi:hypothetical protein
MKTRPYTANIQHNETSEKIDWMEKTFPSEYKKRWWWMEGTQSNYGYTICFRDEADYVLYCLRWS